MTRVSKENYKIIQIGKSRLLSVISSFLKTMKSKVSFIKQPSNTRLRLRKLKFINWGKPGPTWFTNFPRTYKKNHFCSKRRISRRTKRSRDSIQKLTICPRRKSYYKYNSKLNTTPYINFPISLNSARPLETSRTILSTTRKTSYFASQRTRSNS